MKKTKAKYKYTQQKKLIDFGISTNTEFYQLTFFYLGQYVGIMSVIAYYRFIRSQEQLSISIDLITLNTDFH